MNCRDIIQFLMMYLDDELPENVKACFDMHMQMCPDCVHYMQTYQKTVEITKISCQEHSHEQCAEIPEALVQAIIAARRSAGSS
jgi:anti-sigma factor RsiW